jgi:hypothetical protein
MAAFELRIYGKDDTIIKTFATNTVRWGVFLRAVGIQEEMDGKSADEQVVMVNDFVNMLFPDLTENELKNADAQDVMNLFWQLVRKANQIGKSSKNALGAE